MKVIKPFFLGLLGGLVLALALLTGLYFTPLREAVYFRADPEMADVRGKLAQYRDWLAQADLYIQEKGPAASDSLQTAQNTAWHEYKKWRTHLGDLARAHAHPTAEGFWTWTYSLRYWAGPSAIFLALFPAFFAAWRSHHRFRAGRSPRPKANRAKTKAQAQAMSSFEDAIKKVARLSEAGQGASVASSARDHSSDEPPTAPMPVTFEDDADGDASAKPYKDQKEPDTKPFAIVSDTGLETNFLQTGPVWGEPQDATFSDNAIGAGPGGPSPGGPDPDGLSMEDEDGDSDGEDSRGAMPPTTEVERVERRKAEVLKLARKGLTSSEISRRMRISQDQVEFIIRLRREKG